MVTIICQSCGTETTAKNKGKKYCDDCLRKRKIMQVMQAKKRRVPTTEIGVGSGRASSNRKGLENQNTTTGIMLYRSLIPTEKCSQCNSIKNLCVHHKDEDRKNSNPENLICLCKKCHQQLHCTRDPITGRYTKR